MSRIIPLPGIAKRILILRGHRVLLGTDLAELYEVEPKALVQAVKRNIARFPDDFMFQLSWDELDRVGGPRVGEAARSRSQFVTLKRGGNIKYLPYAFTEQGVAMLSSVLRSNRAIEVNIEIMRAFVRLREILAGNRELAKKLAELEKRYDSQFRVVFETIRELMEPPDPTERRRIGFGQREEP
ncbi:MAG: ORF6N domain-containing protein [Myxococcaceae bacterium]